MKELAEAIVNEILLHLEPELHKAMVERIICVSLEKWRTRFTGDAEIGAMIDKAINQAIEGKYKPILDYIADKKAREKVIKRAEQNGIKADEIMPLFEKKEGSD